MTFSVLQYETYCSYFQKILSFGKSTNIYSGTSLMHYIDSFLNWYQVFTLIMCLPLYLSTFLINKWLKK